MAKIYALLTKFTWGLYIFAGILGLAKSWVKPHWVIIGAIILLFLTIPALAITDLTKQVEKLKKLVETPEQSNKIKDVIKPKSEVKTSEQPKKIKDVIFQKNEYEIITGNRKTFAVIKDGNPDNLYCPHCFSQVNPTSNSCPKCNHNFEEDIVQDDVTPSDVWFCTKCGASNPVGTMLCRKCGQ